MAESKTEQLALTDAAGNQLVATRTQEGLLPPPEILERYEALCPGAAQAFPNHLAREQEHRHDMERQWRRGIDEDRVLTDKQLTIKAQELKVKADEKRRTQWTGTILGITAMLVAPILGWLGSDLLGIGYLVFNLSALVIAATLQSRAKEKEKATEELPPERH